MKNIELIIRENEERIFPVVWINEIENEIHLTARLTGNDCSLLIVGIFLGTGVDSITFTTDVIHEGLRTKSLTKIRTVCLENCSFNNEGMIRIKKGAKNTNTYFDSKVLLFDYAKGRSIPSLEIDENEVKAGHAATIGRPDAEQLFYMQSRGLSEKEAEMLLIRGFFDPVIQLLAEKEQKNVRRKLEKHLKSKMTI